jgi:Mu transposase, C-terminal
MATPHPDSLEALDLLLIMVATPRTVHRDGIRFQGLRYHSPILAPYVGKPVTIRYDPRNLSEIRVFHHDRFLCRAINRPRRRNDHSQRHPGRPRRAPACAARTNQQPPRRRGRIPAHPHRTHPHRRRRDSGRPIGGRPSRERPTADEPGVPAGAITVATSVQVAPLPRRFRPHRPR